MLREIFNLVVNEFHNNQKKGSTIDRKIVQIIEEIDELEVQYAKALADAERWGDLNDTSHYRTVEVNRIKRVIEAKRKMIETLKNF